MLPLGILNASTMNVRMMRKRRIAVLTALIPSHIHRPRDIAPRLSSAVRIRSSTTIPSSTGSPGNATGEGPTVAQPPA